MGWERIRLSIPHLTAAGAAPMKHPLRPRNRRPDPDVPGQQSTLFPVVQNDTWFAQNAVDRFRVTPGDIPGVGRPTLVVGVSCRVVRHHGESSLTVLSQPNRLSSSDRLGLGTLGCRSGFRSHLLLPSLVRQRTDLVSGEWTAGMTWPTLYEIPPVHLRARYSLEKHARRDRIRMVSICWRLN